MKTKRTIRTCKDDFSYVCPKLWDKLERTGDGSIRFCPECKENVHLCTTDEETIQRAQAGQCIAREVPDESGLAPLMVGRPKNPIIPTVEQKEAGEWYSRERGIDKSLKHIKRSHRACPKCGYPAPDWRPACSVCGEHIGRI